MQTDRLTAVIRPRVQWEGIDLGFALARHWYPALFGLWWVTALPVGLLGAFFLAGSPSLWLLLVWWLKPLYEAPLLFWLSRALFGETPGPAELWQARRRILPLRLIPNLLWRRLHPSRSFQMPLLLLEGVRGKARRRRQRVLQGPGSAAAWLTVICVHLESILWISALLVMAFLIPEELPGLDLSAALVEEGSAPYWISTLAYWLAMSVIAPFYIAGGFGLYLTRRTELEAWDLELQFRRADAAVRTQPLPLAKRTNRRVRGAAAVGNARRRGNGLTSVVVAACLCFSLLPEATPAADMNQALTQAPTKARAKAEIEAVLSGDDFGTTREVEGWTYVGSAEQPTEGSELPDWLASWLSSVGRGAELAAVVLKWGLILAAAVLLFLIVQRLLERLPGSRGPSGKPGKAASVPRSLAMRAPVRIPPDVAGAVRARIAAGDLRAALALLYAASIDLLRRRHGLGIPASATELEALALVRQARPAAEAERMLRLVRIWQRLAYAHREPGPTELDVLLRDWSDWEARADAD